MSNKTLIPLENLYKEDVIPLKLRSTEELEPFIKEQERVFSHLRMPKHLVKRWSKQTRALHKQLLKRGF